MSAFEALERFFKDPLNRKREIQMAKTAPVKTITFTPSDYKPKRLASGLIGFRAPYDIKIKDGKTQSVDLQTVCSVPLLVSFEFSTDVIQVQPQTKIVIDLVNDHGEDLEFAAGDVIARGYPLFAVDYEIE
jgi:hypothetical protein